MPKTKQQKKEIINQLKDDFSQAKSVVFTSYHGLTVADVEELRGKMREEDVKYGVAKKTLIKKALEDTKIKGIDVDKLEKEVAVSFGMTDEVMPARILKNFSKDHDQIEFLGGVLEGKYIEAAEVSNLSMIPTRDELLAKVVGSIKAPVSGLVNVLKGNLRNLVYVLNAVKESKS